MPDPLSGWQKLGPGDLVAHGITPPGPLGGWVKSSDPVQNAQTIREGINPPTQPPAAPESPNWFQRAKAATTVDLPVLGKTSLLGVKPAPAALAAPGAGILGSMAGQGIAAGAEALVGGKSPLQAGKDALGGAVGGGVGGGIAKVGERLFSPAIKAAFEGRTGRKLAQQIQSLVPAWAGLPKNAKGLYEMAHGEGENLLDATFKGAKNLIPAGHVTEVPIELAQAAKITGARVPIAAKGSDEGPIMVKVATRELVDGLPLLRQKGRGFASDAWHAMDRSLEGVPGAALQAARSQYRNGMGWVEFAEKGGFLKGEKYDAAKAMAALDKHGKELLSRGMQGVRGTVRGPLADPIKAGNLGRIGTAIGGVAGGLAGHGLGVPGEAGGLIGGGYLGHMLGKQIPSYSNVPSGELAKFLSQMATRAGAVAGKQAVSE